MPIGIILCKYKNRIIVEYALKDINKPIGVASYITKEDLAVEFAGRMCRVGGVKCGVGDRDINVWEFRFLWEVYHGEYFGDGVYEKRTTSIHFYFIADEKMKFVRTKQIVFTNNKGGVGKTTLAFNVAKKLSDKGYKVVLIDADPQCNLSRLALGQEFFEDESFLGNNIYKTLEPILEGKGDVVFDMEFVKLSEKLFLLPGNISLSLFESILGNSFNEAAAGLLRGYSVTSAIDRFMKKKGLYEEIDIFIIDTNPSLSLLNKALFLGTDYFVVPMMPDLFNFQGISNMGIFFERERKNWNLSAKVLARENNVSSGEVLFGEPIFLGYIINSYNVYAKKMIYSQNKRREKLPNQIKEYLSYKHCKNGLVDISYQEPIGQIQDYGQLSTLSQEKTKAIFDITETEAKVYGTKENLKKSQEEFETIVNNLIERLKKW